MSAPAIRVLVVDDDPDQRLLAHHLFSAAGITDLAEAYDGRHALELAATFDPSLIVLDLAMPVLSGIDVLPALHEAAPRARIVVVSHFPEHRVGAAVRHRGAVGYVQKSVAPDRFVDEILLAAELADVAAERIASSRFPLDRLTPRSARRFVRETIAGGGEDAPGEETLASSELLVSELVTNAVVHASSEPRVDVRLGDRSIRVQVFDADPTLPTRRSPDAETPGGRGLLLLDAMASRWGAEALDDGKVVWFELDRV